MTDTISLILVLVPALVIAIVFHEVAHGYAARLLGDPTASERGRLTLNPIAHVDPVGTLLVPGGRLAVVSFHSLEDRRVKQYLRDASGAAQGSRHMPAGPAAVADFRLVSRKAIQPGEEETRRNPRARSARLRVAERTGEGAR